MANSAFSALITATGTASQVDVTPGLYPIYSISANPIIPGTAGTTLPSGTTAQRGGAAGTIRFNTQTIELEGTLDGVTWFTFVDAAGPILSITGTAGRITVTAGPNPVIDIDPTYIGQNTITTLGTITTGVWSGTAITEIHGGTNQTTYALGDSLYASAANTLAKLAGNITAVKQYLSQTGTGAVSAAPVWATISGADITGAALSKTDDTNVTMTLGGTPLTALLRAASMTLGWAGQLSLARGGTNANLTASLGGIFYSTATEGAILAGTATARQMLQSGASGAPAWSTSTWPATTTINEILYSSAANTIAGIATAASAFLATSAGGVPSMITAAAALIQMGAVGVVKTQIFTATGAGTYTPSTGMIACIAIAVGAGGGGGGVAATNLAVAGGGGAGGTSIGVFSAATIGASRALSVGALGAGGAAGNNPGTAGSATTFGAAGVLLTANGGNGGQGSPGGLAVTNFSSPGNGGSASAGTVNFSGNPGTCGVNVGIAAGSQFLGGTGGASFFGGGAVGQVGDSVGLAAAAYGGGGAGAVNTSTTAHAGGNGANGVIYIIEFCNQ